MGGVVYIERVPRGMKVSFLKEYFADFGELGRVFKRSGRWQDCWVEFVNKKDAKRCEETLRGNPVGGKSRFRHELWNVQYLHSFQFDNLEKLKLFKRELFEQKVRTEVRELQKQNSQYMAAVKKNNKKKKAGKSIQVETENLQEC